MPVFDLVGQAMADGINARLDLAEAVATGVDQCHGKFKTFRVTFAPSLNSMVSIS